MLTTSFYANEIENIYEDVCYPHLIAYVKWLEAKIHDISNILLYSELESDKKSLQRSDYICSSIFYYSDLHGILNCIYQLILHSPNVLFDILLQPYILLMQISKTGITNNINIHYTYISYYNILSAPTHLGRNNFGINPAESYVTYINFRFVTT